MLRVGTEWIACTEPVDVVFADGGDAFGMLDRIARGGFWVGYCAYDLGRAVERVPTLAVDDLALPDLAFVRFAKRTPVAQPTPRHVSLGDARSSMTRAEHTLAVERVHELLRAGECYELNLTRRLTFDAAPPADDLLGALVHGNPAPYAMSVRFGPALPGVAIVSASPELFLRVGGRRVETRPIKGTAADASALRASAKDRAENVIVVDLARNDLGRVCEPGSVIVTALCRVEQHPGLHHLVSRVQGRLRDGIGLGDLVRATFPPASVTGAPKPRVLRAIEELEPVRRGVYCGAVGWVDGDRGRAELAVAIRTFTIARGETMLGVGGGIVADSNAAAEWAETELKASRLLAAVSGREADAIAAGAT